MKKILITALLLFSISTAITKVYICTGPQSKCYHKTNTCRGLKSCSKEVKAVTLKEAKDMGRRPCKICYEE